MAEVLSLESSKQVQPSRVKCFAIKHEGLGVTELAASREAAESHAAQCSFGNRQVIDYEATFRGDRFDVIYISWYRHLDEFEPTHIFDAPTKICCDGRLHWSEHYHEPGEPYTRETAFEEAAHENAIVLADPDAEQLPAWAIAVEVGEIIGETTFEAMIDGDGFGSVTPIRETRPIRRLIPTAGELKRFTKGGAS